MTRKRRGKTGFLVSVLLFCFFLSGCSLTGENLFDIPKDVREPGLTEHSEEIITEKETAVSESEKTPAAEKLPEEVITEAQTEPETAALPALVENGFSVCIDAGHQGSWVDMSALEPNAPGSSEMKARCTTGTQGIYTGVPEYQLNLDISLKLKAELEKRGYRVVMTREDNDTAISNSERAILASDSGCDISVRIHANGSDDHSVSGALAMVMSPDNPYVSDLFPDSQKLAQCILSSYCAQTGFANLGIQFVDNMTGINWCTVPVMILEMGFMSNEHDDYAMQDPETQMDMVTGIAKGIDSYFGINTDEYLMIGGHTPGSLAEEKEMQSGDEDEPGGPLSEIVQDLLKTREADGEKWSLSMEILTDGKGNPVKEGESVFEYQGDLQMQSASVIKVFIMAAVYDRICYPNPKHEAVSFTENYDGELRSLLENMIRVSDNDAANRLVEILGNGDFNLGSQVIASFCAENGYIQTKVGRRFLDSNPTDDNYVSARDCRKLLASIYRGTCVNQEASEKMMTILKGQQVLHKIPSGLPSGEFTSANKTGEMPLGYGLGCIENDIAVIFSPYGDYVLTVLSNELNGRNDEAQEVIRQISARVSQWMIGEETLVSETAAG